MDWTDGDDPYAAAAPLLEPGGRYAISDSAWAMHVLALQAALPDTSYVSMTAVLPMLRAIKDADEIERLAAAGAAADASLEEIVKVRFAGRTENEVAADLAALLRKHGHSQVDFTVVGSGPNGANPHHEAGDRTIQNGDMVVLDFGGLKDGYGSDTTRSVHVGEPTDEEREVFEIVRRAQQAGFEAVRPGVACQEIDRAARKVITDAGYGEYFIHRVGHGIGLTTHEPPYMVEGEDASDPAGHVLLDRARHLPTGPLRRADRGHRGRHRGRRPPAQQHPSRDARRGLTRPAPQSCRSTSRGIRRP